MNLSAHPPSGQGPTRAVVLCSGGLDSSVCLGVARQRGHQIYALSFRYGQRHQRELACAAFQAQAAGAVKHLTLEINLDSIGGSALVGQGEVPKPGSVAGMTSAIPATYVPARNTIFLSLALGWAEVLQASAIYIGVNAVDYSGYPDCRPEFLEAFSRMARLATKAGVSGDWRLTIETPLIDLSKAEIVKLGVATGVDLANTWSCYDPTPEGRPCLACDSCVLRAKGFAEAGLEDPALLG